MGETVRGLLLTLGGSWENWQKIIVETQRIIENRQRIVVENRGIMGETVRGSLLGVGGSRGETDRLYNKLYNMQPLLRTGRFIHC